MTEARHPEPVRALLRLIVGSRETIAGTVYGTVVVLAVLTAGGRAYEHDDLWQLVTLDVTTVLVLWVSHVYAHGLSESLQHGRRLRYAEIQAIARRESAVPVAAIAPTSMLVLGAVGVLDGRTAVRAAFTIGIITLAAQGLRYAAVERLGRLGTILAAGINVALSLVLVLLEVVVSG